MIFKIYPLLLSFLALTLVLSCSLSDEEFSLSTRKHSKGEYIYRNHDEYFFTPPPPLPMPKTSYPWDLAGNLPAISKEYLRCRGSPLNPPLTVDGDEGEKKLYDCEGERGHGLPLREGEEFVYPILIEILNYVQRTTGRRVVVTSGHRCPQHNSYVDPSKENFYSKHMIAAEVDFYVAGYEKRPHEIVDIIRQYYAGEEKKELSTFLRYEQTKSNLRTPPWYNKELFIKIYESDEGRNCDNSHPHPYIALQVRYDRDRKESVSYSWKEANKGYLRR